jgi:hypothetical protein
MMPEEPIQDQAAPAKRPYEPPRLTVYGTVHDLTAALGVAGVDGFAGGS